MKLSDIMSHAGLAIYAEVALVLFLLAFLGITWWVFRARNAARFEQEALLPLDDDFPQPPSRARGR